MSEPNSCSRSGGTYSCAGGPTNYVTTEADEKWRSKLTADEYRVARERATEPVIFKTKEFCVHFPLPGYFSI